MDSFSWLFPQTAQQLNRIEAKVEIIMAQVQVAQEDLDALDTSLDQVTADLTTHIDALVAAAQSGEPLPEADLTALQEDVAALQALSAPQPTEEPTPEEPA